MKANNFNIIVKNILKYKNKLIWINKIKEIIKNLFDSDYTENKAYKIIYQLKNKWYILNLKKSIFLVKDPDKEFDNQQLLENFYRSITKKHCSDFILWKWYIWWLKALELNSTNYDIPDDILIVNEEKQATETIMFDKQLFLKKYESDWKSLFNFFFTFTKKIYIWKNQFNIANLELSILESLYNPSIPNKIYIEESIKKIIRKNKKYFNLSVIESILKKNKHHTSINRLYKLCLGIDPELSEKIKNIIKKYSYFISD